jgi:lipoprotein-releasing system permease protein
LNLPFYIARRYFLSKKKTQFINIISIISMIVVAVGTMALIIALSVFNGLEEVVRGLHATFNADLQITIKKGKSFSADSLFLQKIRKIEGVALVTEVIEDNAVLNYRDEQMVVLLKGVSDNFTAQSAIDTALVDGTFELRRGNRAFAVIGRGVQIKMGISLMNTLDQMQLWYPRKTKKVNLSNFTPEKNFNRRSIFPAGVFSLEQAYDEKYVFVPIAFAESLLEYGNRRTSLELKVKAGAKVTQVQARLKTHLGNDFYVKTSDEQQAGLLRAIKIEKLFMYLTLSFILGVASFNIFFALMMLVIDKKKDIAVLQSMGATHQLIRRIFFLEGVIIAFFGAALGLCLGTLFCVLQQQYGFIKLGTATTVVSAYPVKLQTEDFLFTGITIILITLASSYFPALSAGKVGLKENL